MILSKIRPLVGHQATALRLMSEHRVFPLQPSRWQWNKFKDLFHFYVFLGAIPLALLTTYVNVFIGPATLTEIPEDYTPKHWEYYRSPITRFIARYMKPSPQQEYEKYLAYLFMENEKRELRFLEAKIKDLMRERTDYQAYYYKPVAAKYHRVSREAYEAQKDREGD